MVTKAGRSRFKGPPSRRATGDDLVHKRQDANDPGPNARPVGDAGDTGSTSSRRKSKPSGDAERKQDQGIRPDDLNSENDQGAT